MKITGIFILLLFLNKCTAAQIPQGNLDSTKWGDVIVMELHKLKWNDTLEICGGEWFVDGSGKNVTDLDAATIERIKKTVANHGCSIAFVDVKNYYTSPGKNRLYVCGVKRKE